MVFRWSTVATKTTDKLIIKYQKDNWNNAVYVEKMNVPYSSYEKSIVEYPTWGYTSSLLTSAWGVLLGSNIIWLTFSLAPKRKRGKEEMQAGE